MAEPWGFFIEERRFSFLCSIIARTAGADIDPATFAYQPEKKAPPPHPAEIDPMIVALKKALTVRPGVVGPQSTKPGKL